MGDVDVFLSIQVGRQLTQVNKSEICYYRASVAHPHLYGYRHKKDGLFKIKYCQLDYLNTLDIAVLQENQKAKKQEIKNGENL